MFNKDMILKNSENVKNIDDFINHKMGENGNVFVCVIGENNSFKSDVLRMDDIIQKGFAYNRISSFPMLTPDDAAAYEGKYNDWLRSFKRKAVTRATVYNENKSEALSAALSQTAEVFRKSKRQITDSIEKNFMIKMLFWYDFVSADIAFDGNISNGVKIVGENVSKLQDYLFFYMLALTGADVLLLQNKVDLDIQSKNLNVSSRVVLGHLGSTDIPRFSRFSSPRNTNSGTFAGASAPRSGSDGNVRVTVPPRPGRQNTVIGTAPQPGNNIRVTMPPRPGRQNTVIGTAPQPGNNIRVTVPPRPGRQNTVIGTTPQPSNNIRVTVPPRPGRQSTVIRPDTSRQNVWGNGSVNSSPYRDGQLRLSASPQQPTSEKSYEQLAQLASSVVQIVGLRKRGYGGGNNDFFPIGSGSGIMISHDGYILTNWHVAKETSDYMIKVENDSNVYYTNRLIKYHRDFDLAIIKIDRKCNPLPIYKGQKPLARGQRVVAIGSPRGMFNTVSDGIISGFRTINNVDMIQFTAPISNGSSGGALLNMYGEVVGISTAGFDEAQNINFAIGYEMILNFSRGLMGLI